MKLLCTAMLALGLLAIMGPCSVTADCDASTCPPGPVIVQFEFENCTGEVTYYATGDEAGCQGSLLTEIDDSGISYIYTHGSVNCDISQPNSSFSVDHIQFGRCMSDNFLRRRDVDNFLNTGALRRSGVSQNPHAHAILRLIGGRGKRGAKASNSIMFLANVNATFESPQPVFEFNPTRVDYEEMLVREDCFGADNCTMSNGEEPIYYENYYSDINCLGTATAEMFPNVTLANSECVNFYNGTYAKLSCLDEHGFLVQHFMDSECSGPLLRSQAVRQVCGSSMTATIHCNTPVLPVQPSSPSAPSSASSPLYTTSLFLAGILFATALFF